MNVYIGTSGEVKNIYLGEGRSVSDMQGPAPDGFHVPLKTEWQAIYDAYTGLGLSGGTNFSTYLKLPMAGDRYYDKTVYNVGSSGAFWCSSYDNDNNYSRYIRFNSSNIGFQVRYRSYGHTVRCLKNSPTIPTASWTVLYQGSGSAGIFHNPTDGLISISSDGTTWYTIMDKNLGATIVYNYGDTLIDANCGNVFQWGNNYPFPGTLSSDSITTSSTRVNTTGYGPGNYYSSSTWINYSGNWSSTSNKNLRGGVSQGSIIKPGIKEVYIGTTKVYPAVKQFATQGPCPDGFHVPLKSDFDDLVSCMTTFGLNTAGYYQSMLKMPNNGFRQYSDGVIYNTNQGRYWTSSASTGTEYAYHLVFSSSAPSSTVSTSSNTKEYGYNIRPFKNTPVAPDSSWTELYSNSIYHNSTLGLISIKNGSSWITIADKNLGATVVFNSGDTVTADNGGTWYQRGNNYGFPRSGSVTTSSTQVNTTGYGPGNYYSRNIFVVSSSLRDWSSVTNDNLRGGVDGNVPVS